MAALTHIIEPGGYVGFEIDARQALRLTDLEGAQVADLISFNRDDPREQLSMMHTRAIHLTWKFTAPHKLYTNVSREMWQIEEDSLGEHYCGGGYCSDHLNRARYGKADTRNCQDNLTAALKPYGLDNWSFCTDTCFNIFMTVAYDPDGRWEIRDPKGKAGEHIVLRALMPQIVAISNCPQVLNACNAYNLTPLQVEVY